MYLTHGMNIYKYLPYLHENLQDPRWDNAGNGDPPGRMDNRCAAMRWTQSSPPSLVVGGGVISYLFFVARIMTPSPRLVRFGAFPI